MIFPLYIIEFKPPIIWKKTVIKSVVNIDLQLARNQLTLS